MIGQQIKILVKTERSQIGFPQEKHYYKAMGILDSEKPLQTLDPHEKNKTIEEWGRALQAAVVCYQHNFVDGVPAISLDS